MRQLALIALFLLWIAPVQAETGAFPDGVEPLRFGMTKEEALAALDGKGKVEEEKRGSLAPVTWITYEARLNFTGNPDGGLPVTVKHQLTSAGVGMAKIEITPVYFSDNTCVQQSQRIAAIIGAKYQRTPVFSGIWDEQNEEVTHGIYTFGFPNGATIEVNFTLAHPEDFPRTHHRFCYQAIFLTPPLPTPFML